MGQVTVLMRKLREREHNSKKCKIVTKIVDLREDFNLGQENYDMHQWEVSQRTIQFLFKFFMCLPDTTFKIQFLLAGCDEWVAIKHKEFSRCIYLSFSKCKDEIYVAWRSTRLIRKICYYFFFF